MAERRTGTGRLLGALVSFLLLAALLALFFAFRERAGALHAPPFKISFGKVPYYAFCSFYRMFAAYVLALIFAIVYGLNAARGKTYERVMIPAIDIAQSVPVVGFFPAAVYFFVALGHGRRLGVEMAAIFLIFTSQAWNMALGVYEAVRTIPDDSVEALEAFGVGGWLKFKRLLLPASVPKLVYNSILSWVAGWYYLIACEIITVGPARYRLPGLGSLLMEAADRGQWSELIGGLATLLLIIVAMDVIGWQPLSVWAEKFRYEFAASAAEPIGSLGMLGVLSGIGPGITRALRRISRPLAGLLRRGLESLPKIELGADRGFIRIGAIARAGALVAILVLFGYAIGAGLIALFHTLVQPWPAEVRRIPAATGASMLRMATAYAISLGWTLPCALVASDSPRFNRWLAPAAEIAGSIPATALFPLIVLFVIKVTGVNLVSILLILTGMQWYLLFNLLAGVSQIPGDLKEAARSFGLSRLATWKKVVVPGLLPSLVTGSMTAWGGGWNALILSEYFVYGGKEYKVLGLGALLDEATYQTGNGVMILLSLLSMVAVVIGLNRLLWRRVYDRATERYKLDY